MLQPSPRPAGLSEKYSNSVDTTLASGLEARSYQPVLNSYKDSATLMSLKRRDDLRDLAHPLPLPRLLTRQTRPPLSIEQIDTGIREIIKSGLGENEYSKIEPDLTKDIKKLEYDFKVGYDEILVYISKIAKGDGTVTYNFQKVDTLFEDFFYGNMEFIRKLRFQLEKFEAGETLKKSLADIVGAVNDFHSKIKVVFVIKL
ncbi:hypothetical protein BASA60_003875 [Batrachochytrium salamandrivorans]|nr:hypothetical protein BASA60_003875 [Batrachochytrium salamandrivorans]